MSNIQACIVLWIVDSVSQHTRWESKGACCTTRACRYQLWTFLVI